MARRRDQESPKPAAGPTRPAGTRTGAAWLSITLLVAFVVLLIVFIAQNDRKVPLHFLGAKGTVSEAVALVVAAASGALLVVLFGTARILQLRLGARRARRDLKRERKAGPSAAATPQGEAQPVEPEDKS